jgi:hypothetical protein
MELMLLICELNMVKTVSLLQVFPK